MAYERLRDIVPNRCVITPSCRERCLSCRLTCNNDPVVPLIWLALEAPAAGEAGTLVGNNRRCLSRAAAINQLHGALLYGGAHGLVCQASHQAAVLSVGFADDVVGRCFAGGTPHAEAG